MKTKIAALLLSLFCCAAFAANAADPIVISSSCDRDEALIGDRLNYEVSVEWDESEIEFGGISPGEELGVFEIAEFGQVSEETQQDGRRVRSWVLRLAAFETGEFEIPPFEIAYRRIDGEEQTARTQPISIAVRSVLDPGQESIAPKDFKAPADILPDPKYRRRTIAIVCAGVALILGAVALIWWLRKQRGEAEERFAPRRPVEEIALEQLDALESEGLAARGEFKAYYSRISEILRVYLGARYRIQAIDMTTFELLGALDGRMRDETSMRAHEEFCVEADLAKFAKWRAPGERCAAALSSARFIVRQTTPRPPASAESEMSAREEGAV